MVRPSRAVGEDPRVGGTTTRLPEILDALGRSEADPAVRRLTDAFGGDPTSVLERVVGEPGFRSRRLQFASGGEIILHDGAVVAVLLHLVSTPFAPHGLDLSDWVEGLDNRAGFADAKRVFDAPWRFGGNGSRCFSLDGGYVRMNERAALGEPRRLVGLAITAEEPWLTCRPEDDDCPTCSGLLVRPRGAAEGIDVDATIDALSAAAATGALKEDGAWVRLADLRLLHASGLMERVESQLACRACHRVSCLTLFRDAPPTFGYHGMDQARQRPLGAIPPVEQWGDAERVARSRDAMRYVDHEPGAWFLVEKQGALYLDARYVLSTMLDDSALVRLSEPEVEDYRARGHDAVSDLARRIHDGSPHRETSPFHERNLYRGEAAGAYRDEVRAAIVNHTWLAEHRRKA